MRRVAVLGLLVALPACLVEHRVSISGQELHRGLWALRHQGATELVVVHQLGGYDPTTGAEVIRADTPLTVGSERTTPLALGQGCLDLPPADDVVPTDDAACPLLAARDVDFELRAGLERNWRPVKKAVVPTLLVGGFSAAVVCASACAEGSTPRLASDVALGTVGALFVGALVWGAYECLTGASTCHD